MFVALYVSLETSQNLFVLSQACLCAAILFIPTLLIGLVFPLAVELTSRVDDREAGHVGRLYALNTTGAIAGVLLAELLFIAQVVLGHLPFIFGRPIHDVCIIGLGTGVTAGAVTLSPVRQAEVIEIEPAVIEASAFFDSINHRPLTDPRVVVRVDDARNALLVSSSSSYDLIVSQPSYPWASGSSKLFTWEFYHLAQTRLRTPGIFAQWVQLYNMDFASVMTLLKTFTLVFPQTLVMQVGGSSGEILLLGTTDQALIPWPALSHIFSSPRRAEELTRIGVSNPGTILARLLLGPQEIPPLVAAYPTNTDDNGWLEFSAVRSLYRHTICQGAQESLP